MVIRWRDQPALSHDAPMGEALDDGVRGGARALARMVEPFHAITYYSQEMADLRPHGYKGWWHAYFGYRPAPMGEVGAATVTATFYNFAPRMVARAVPGVWAHRSAADTIELRRDLVASALERIFRSGHHDAELAAGADLVRRALDRVDGGARPLYAAYRELSWPDHDALSLWHGCTLLRELRGDSHNIALAAAEVDGVASHVLMAGRGYGNRPTILAIRGWTDEEWDEAVEGLQLRGWVDGDGALTSEGRQARSAIEHHTDQLAGGPVRALGDDLDRFLAVMEPLVGYLRDEGEVSGRWPPPHVMKPASSGLGQQTSSSVDSE